MKNQLQASNQDGIDVCEIKDKVLEGIPSRLIYGATMLDMSVVWLPLVGSSRREIHLGHDTTACCLRSGFNLQLPRAERFSAPTMGFQRWSELRSYSVFLEFGKITGTAVSML